MRRLKLVVRFWASTLASSLLLGLGGLTLILFLYSVGFLVASELGNPGATPVATEQATNIGNPGVVSDATEQITDLNLSNLSLGIMAVFITLFIGVALKTFDFRNEVFNALENARQERRKEGQKHTEAREKLKSDLRIETSSTLKEAEKKWQEEGQKHDKAREKLRRDTLRLRQQLEIVAKTSELAASRATSPAFRGPQVVVNLVVAG